MKKNKKGFYELHPRDFSIGDIIRQYQFVPNFEKETLDKWLERALTLVEWDLERFVFHSAPGTHSEKNTWEAHGCTLTDEICLGYWDEHQYVDYLHFLDGRVFKSKGLGWIYHDLEG